MAFGGFNRAGSAAPMAEINMVPLIDVMLVMLVIFIVTAPLLTHSVNINLPRASSTPTQTLPEHVSLALNAAGVAYWNGEAVSRPVLAQRLAAAAAQSPQPELQLRADRATPYQHVAEVMAAAARARITRIGFLSDPSDPSDASATGHAATTPRR